MDRCTASPFPVDPADVPAAAVSYVKRTMLRHAGAHPMDDDVARLIVAGVIAVLAGPDAMGAASVLVSRYTAATGSVVAIQAQLEAGAGLAPRAATAS